MIKSKRDLKQVFALKKELRLWQMRRAELELDIAPPIKQITGMPFANTNGVNMPTEEKAIRLMEAARNIDAKIKEIEAAIIEIEEFILSVEDSFTRQLLELRCVRCMKWDEIAEVFGEGYTAEALKTAYSRNTDKLLKGGNK